MFIPSYFFDDLLKKFSFNANAAVISKISSSLSVIVSTLLILMKTGAWLSTKSIVIQASLLDSLMDLASSLAAFLAISYSFKSPDECHGHGHGKIEGMVSIIQVVFMTFASFQIFKDAYDGVTNPTGISHTFVGVITMIVSSVLVYILVSFQRYSVQKTQSVIVFSDSLHYSSDLLMNFGVLLSLLMSSYLPHIDAIAGFLVCIYILVSAVKIFKNSIVDLIDAELPKEDKLKIIEKIKEDQAVLKIAHMKTRRSGTKKIVQADVFLDKNLTFIESFCMAKKIEQNVGSLFINSEILIVPVPSNEP